MGTIIGVLNAMDEVVSSVERQIFQMSIASSAGTMRDTVVNTEARHFRWWKQRRRPRMDKTTRHEGKLVNCRCVHSQVMRSCLVQHVWWTFSSTFWKNDLNNLAGSWSWRNPLCGSQAWTYRRRPKRISARSETVSAHAKIKV